MKLALLLFAAGSLLAPAAPAPPIRLGIDVLLDSRADLIAGKRVGLITNPSGVDGALRLTADRLAEDGRFQLVQLYGPEHGIRGDAPADAKIANSVDPVTGVPVESLYGERKRPSKESLARLDVLLFDIQDVGSRTYTYIATLGEAMRAAADAGVKVIVLDRPNPLGGLRFEGPIREEAHASFVGWGPLPLTHGMTVGEVARFYAERLDIGCELEVVRMEGWTRAMTWSDTGLAWTQTSPHIPHFSSAALYVATGMVGGVSQNVCEGVGTPLPFELIAADFFDARALAASLNAAGLPGLRFAPIAVQPFYGKFEKQALRGVRLVLDDPAALRPVRTALTILVTLERLYPGRVQFQEGRTFNIHWGTPKVLELVRAGKSTAEIEASWARELEEFGTARDRCLLYR